MLDIELLALVCFIVPAELNYISSSTSNSSEATLSCKLAIPEIIYSQEGRKVVLNRTLPDKGVQFQNGSLYWVGYAETYQAFLYLGCASAANVDNASYRDDSMSPGQCYSACKTDTFGIQNFSCYCLSREPNRTALLNIRCTMSCNTSDGVLCGGDNVVSVYKKVLYRNGKPLGDSGAECRLFEKKNRRITYYSWAQCNTQKNHTCHNDVEEFLFNNFTGEWSSSVQKCLEYGYYPAGETYNATTFNLTVYGHFWTGTIRSYSVFSMKDLVKQNISSSEFRQGYIKYMDMDGDVSLGFDHASSELASICERETSSSVTSTSTIPTTLPPSTDNNITTTASTEHITLSTTKTFSTRSTEQTETTNVVPMLTSSVSPKGINEHTNIIVGIATGFALLLLLVGIIIAICRLWRKRKNTGIDNLQESGTHATNKYTVIELSERNKESNYPTNCLDNQHITSSEYDTLSAVAVFRGEEPKKNMIETETDDTYDHIEKAKHGTLLKKTGDSKQKNDTSVTNEEDVENTYDHLEADTREGVYNTVTDIPRRKPMTAADDTYDHVSTRGKILSGAKIDITDEAAKRVPDVPVSYETVEAMDIVYTQPIPRELRNTVDK